MIEFIQKLSLSLICFLQRLDPALMQNVVLGMLALLVPVGVGILSFFFEERSRGKLESNLELFVLLRQVLKVKQIVLFSLLSLLLLSLYELHFLIQITAVIFFSFFIVWITFVPFRNILDWFLKNTKDFSLRFLESLRAKKDDKLSLDAWQALWLGSGLGGSERDFTNIFIHHIDDSIKFGRFDFAVQLTQVYAYNIEKRDRISIAYEILPKIFEWNELLWSKQQLWLKTYDTEKRIQNFFSQEYFPTFRDWALKFYNKLNSKSERFWNWHYFGEDFFQVVIKTLLRDRHGPFQFFSSFKKHIEESEKKLRQITDGKEKEKYWHYITGLFSSFCPTFFNQIDNAPSNYSIWEHDFPPEWKITITNKDNKMSHVIFHEYLQWSRDRIFKKENKENFDKNLTEVINGIFPNVHSSLFTVFLMLFFSSEVKYALEKEPNFYIFGTSISWSGSIEESEEDRDKRLSEMMKAKDNSQKEETVQIILNQNYFARWWNKLKIALDDSNKDEWNGADSEKQKLMLKNARKDKLEKIRTEIGSAEIKEVCKNSERREFYRKDLLELIELLILEIER